VKVLGISGSPRKGGNTDMVLEKALEGARAAGADTEKIVLEDLDISPCRVEEYEKVNEQGFSVVDDDIHIIFRKIQEADAVILASPVFFGSISAQMKIMIDRFQCVWLAKYMLKKDLFPDKIPGAFLCVAATSREDFFENSRSIVRHFCATANIEYKDEIFFPGVDKKATVTEHPEFMEKAYKLGERLAAANT
jgi:multimeric flavodoxin WrbA